MTEDKLQFDRARFEAVLDSLESMVVGDLEREVAISESRDELDALAHGINVLSSELRYRLRELQAAQSSLIQAGKLAALGEVSSGLAHELNNPLTIAAGYIQHIRASLEAGLRSAEDCSLLTAYLQKVERNLDRMNTIIRHIMEFARESKPVKQPLLLQQVIEKSLILMNEQLRLRNVRIEMTLQSGLMTKGNEAKLEQVFINLLTNARDAIQSAHGEAGGQIHVRSKVLSRTELAIEISDTGIGMDGETLSKIFQPFFTTKAPGRGTGLGLSISHGIVQEHGGSISCESEAGRGTTFTLYLPRHLPEDANL